MSPNEITELDANLAAAKATLRGMSRDERRLARGVINDAAADLGMRRRAFMRAVAAGDTDAQQELENSVGMSLGWEWDPERFQQILDMILAFIRALLTIFSGI